MLLPNLEAMSQTHDVVRHETIKLRGFVDGVLADFEMVARARHVTLNALVFSDEVKADASLLHRLLTSLVGGALRRTPTGTNVSLVISPCGRYTEFRVADEGAGIAAEPREGAVNAARGSGGDGSGLTFCRLAAEAHGGRVSVAETDAGTVVCLALPSSATAVPGGGPEAKRKSSRSESGVYARDGELAAAIAAQHTILVVDDEPPIRTFIRRDLKDAGFSVIEAGSAERALEILKANRRPVALLLSDVGLPGASGAELVRQARLLRPELPTLLMSATDKEALVRDGVLEDRTFLLQKPFTVTDLLAKLAELLPPPLRRVTSRTLGSG